MVNQKYMLSFLNLGVAAIWAARVVFFSTPEAKPIVDKAVEVVDSIKTRTAIQDFDYVYKSMKMVARSDSAIEGVSELSDSLTKYIRLGTDYNYKEKFQKNLETYISEVDDRLGDIQNEVTPPWYTLFTAGVYVLISANYFYEARKRRD